MKFNFKKAGEILGNMFTSNPQITEQEREDLRNALDEDGAASLAESVAKVADLEEKLAAAETARAAAETALATATVDFNKEMEAMGGQIIKLTEEKSGLEAKVGEYEPIREQLDAYREQIGGAKPEGGANPASSAKSVREQEIERLKAEFPISMSFMPPAK